MAQVRKGALRLAVYPNDHPPPHTHVLGPGWEIRVELSSPPALMTILGKPKAAEIAAALTATDDNLQRLRVIWRHLHD
jgi:hypothetical protein